MITTCHSSFHGCIVIKRYTPVCAPTVNESPTIMANCPALKSFVQPPFRSQRQSSSCCLKEDDKMLLLMLLMLWIIGQILKDAGSCALGGPHLQTLHPHLGCIYSCKEKVNYARVIWVFIQNYHINHLDIWKESFKCLNYGNNYLIFPFFLLCVWRDNLIDYFILFKKRIV